MFNPKLVQIKTLNKKGVSCLFFNNRGAHYIKNLNIIKKDYKRQKINYDYRKRSWNYFNS